MHRRTVLASVPALLAGCSGVIDGDATTTSTTRTTTVETATLTDAPTAEATETTTEKPFEPVAFETASMTADEVQSSLADRDCADIDDLPAVCPGDDSRLVVSVSPEVANLPNDAVEFTIENRADKAFVCGSYDWTLRKWDGERWRRIAPLAIPAKLNELPAGESHTYRIATSEAEPFDGHRAFAAEHEISIRGLGPGVYGFSTNGYFEAAPDDEFAAAAVFGLAGDGFPVQPTNTANAVERDGSELLVRATQPEREPGELVVSLVEDEPDVRLLPEHVHQLRSLLNILPYLSIDGVETVRYTGNAEEVGLVDTYLSVVTPDGASRYDFHELVFEVSGSE